MEWIDETPNKPIYVSIVSVFVIFVLLMIYASVATESSISSAIGLILLILCLFIVVGFFFAVARTLDLKNRSFWWYGLFILVPLVGMIVILALDDHSNEISEIQQMR